MPSKKHLSAADRCSSPKLLIKLLMLDLQSHVSLIGTAGFDAPGGVSRRCRAEPGKRSGGAAGADAQPATP